MTLLISILDGKFVKKLALISLPVLLLMGLLFTQSVSAVDGETLLFEDEFDQPSDGLKNMWNSADMVVDGEENISSPSRKITDSPNDFVVGVDGTMGLLLEGANSGDPDDGARRHISTKGYSSLRVEYSRSIEEFGSGDEFVADYGLDVDDDSEFTVLETLDNEQEHETVSFDIDNSDRHSRLTLRFYINANGADDRVGIDNVRVYGTGEPLFYDGFESGDFGENWSSSEVPNIAHDKGDDNKMWTDDNSTDQGHDDGDHSTEGHGVEFRAANTADPDDDLILSFGTEGYEDINFRYSRRVTGLEEESAIESFSVYYSTDGGESWASLETFEGGTGNDDDVDYASVSWSELEGVDNNEDFQLKFEITGNADNDKAYIDDVVVWGTETEEPEPETSSISGYKFEDLDGDGEWYEYGEAQPNEPALDGWTIYLFGEEEDSTETDEEGYYEFSGLAPGTYQVCEELMEGWMQTAPNEDNEEAYDCGDGLWGYEIELGESDATERNFGNLLVADDEDEDGVPDEEDNCPSVANEDKTDTDEDGAGDACDEDDDGDGTADEEDDFPLDPDEDTDTDEDGTGDNEDTDDDQDGQSDEDESACGSDPLDNESVSTDSDDDGIPDCVDEDDDNDGTPDDEDEFPVDPDEDTDTDEDGIGDNEDADDDDDGQSDGDETECGSNPKDAESLSDDFDGDNAPDCVDLDDDNDGTPDEEDDFPFDAEENTDTDEDGVGDNSDNCPETSNPEQEDNDEDGIGNACDETPDGDEEEEEEEEDEDQNDDEEDGDEEEDGNQDDQDDSSTSTITSGSRARFGTFGQVLGAEKFIFTQFMKIGSTNNEVLELQKYLQSLRLYWGKLDGIFGILTEAAVKAYQMAHPPLVVDGIVGPLTRAVLNSL